MCGRYNLHAAEDEAALRKVIEEIQRRYKPALVERIPRGEVCPRDVAPVIARGRDGERKPFVMQWGFPVAKKAVINARSETAAQKPLFADAYRQRRCLIPAVSYYEWRRDGGAKLKFEFRPVDGQVFWMAGLYRLCGDLPEFVVLTRAASPSVAAVHDRMPVILPPSGGRAWLDPAANPDAVLLDARGDMAGEAV